MDDLEGTVLKLNDGPDIFELKDDEEVVWIVVGPVAVLVKRVWLDDERDDASVTVELFPNGDEVAPMDSAAATYGGARLLGGISPDEGREADRELFAEAIARRLGR